MNFLLIDADDTLWENNVHFERAFDAFCRFLAHSALSPTHIREILNEIELANVQLHGYGSRNFGRNLQEAYRRLAEREIRRDDLDHVMSLAERILEQPVELIEGVEETLADLAARHQLTLFTKGHPEEQKLKIDRSGLAGFFRSTCIVREKDAAAYRSLVADRSMEPSRSWMIGNSPRSDVNPALEAGLNAVFVPHARTWVLEKEEIRPGRGRFIQVECFGDLCSHF